ncbi:MAG TPA: septal ring lytic transglycosylase RlpA family protein [Nitrospiraceae bacterium]|nr:septal ring lytic transglycosylase RlpA family protein [Nitrospiraceae bacterium]
MKIMCVISAASLAMAAALAQTPPSTQASEMTGVCSYYARMHDGHVTAGGEKFDSNAMTAAHRRLPMGTKLKVTNLANGKSVVVTVNDRGPFVKGRSLSVTRRAAEELGFRKQGVAKVKFEQVQ